MEFVISNNKKRKLIIDGGKRKVNSSNYCTR